MKLPNLQFFAEAGLGFRGVILRFPLAVVSAAVFVYYASLLNESYPLLASSSIGIPLFILASYVSEALAHRNSPWKWIPTPAAIVLLLGYGLTLHSRFGNELHDTFFARLVSVLLVIHLAIAFLPPLLIKSDGRATWEFNKALLSRFLITAFYSAVFYIGTVLAIVSIKELFDTRINDEIFLRIWFFFAFFFNTVLFLGGAPKLSDLKSGTVEIPIWIQFLCKFILLPLVILYFGILYAYLLKIAFAGDWPNGMVGYPVFILSLIGGLTALLMWPLSDKDEGVAWAHTFWRWYFPSIFPLSIVLLMALQKRIGEYGFTELRYSGLVLALWLLAISLFYTIRRKANFQAIPISLCGIVLLCVAGPLSPRSIGQQSQWSRLEGLLISEGWLQQGALKNNPRAISSEDYDRLISMIEYLSSYYGPNQFRDWIEQFPKAEQDRLGWNERSIRSYELGGAIATFLGATLEITSDTHRFVTLNLNTNSSYTLDDSTRFYQTHLTHYTGGKQGFEFQLEGESVFLKLANEGQQLAIQDAQGSALAELDITEWIKEKNLEINPSELHGVRDAESLSFTLDLGTQRGTLRAIANNVQLEYKENTWRFNSGQLYIFVHKK